MDKIPTGYVLVNLEELQRIIKPKAYSPKHNYAEIMFNEGKMEVVRLIEKQLENRK